MIIRVKATNFAPSYSDPAHFPTILPRIANCRRFGCMTTDATVSHAVKNEFVDYLNALPGVTAEPDFYEGVKVKRNRAYNGFLTTSKVARLKGCSIAAVHSAVRAGKLPAFLVGHTRYMSPGDVAGWNPNIKEQAVASH